MNQANFFDNESGLATRRNVQRRGQSVGALFGGSAFKIPSWRRCFLFGMIAVCVTVGTVGLCHQLGWISLLVCQVVELGAVVTFCAPLFLLRPLFTGVIALRGSIVFGFSFLVAFQLCRILATLQVEGVLILWVPMLDLLPIVQPLLLALGAVLLLSGFIFTLLDSGKALGAVASDRDRIASFGARQEEANRALKRILEEKATESVIALSEHRQAEHDKVRLEHQLSQSHKMRAVGTLAGGVAHDFNNILTAILGYADLGGRKAQPDSKEKFYFDEVQRAGMRAKELVRQLLLFSHQGTEDSVAVDLRVLVRDIISELLTVLPDNIRVETDFINSSTKGT